MKKPSVKFNESQIQIIKKINQGAFGTVYLAQDEYTNQQYAIKKIFVSQSNEKETKKAQREIRMQQSVTHQNIVQLYHISQQNQICHLYMEYCPVDLQRFIINTIYPINHQDVKIISYAILNGLVALHKKGIIHRFRKIQNFKDLKPSNIMISNDGTVKIGDFGSASSIENKIEKGGQFSVEGFSKWYIAPEILFGSRKYGTEIDMWSFGCIFAELLNGQPLFPGQGEIEQIVLIGEILGSPNEQNWPQIVNMPDFGKINFKDKAAANFQNFFPSANSEEIDLINRVLNYQNREKAEDLLKLKYFDNLSNQKLNMNEIFDNIENFDEYFEYLDLLK